MDEYILELPVRRRGNSLYVNVNRLKNVLGIEHGDNILVKLSDIEIDKREINKLAKKKQSDTLKIRRVNLVDKAHKERRNVRRKKDLRVL